MTNGSIVVTREKVKPGDYAGESILMSNCFAYNQPVYAYTSPGVISFKKVYPTYSVGGLIFNDVAYFQDTKNASENIYVSPYGSINPTTDFFISKNIGVVKKRIFDTQLGAINKTETLVRYHIVQ